MCPFDVWREIPNINSHTQLENANRDDIETVPPKPANITTCAETREEDEEKKNEEEKQKSKPHVWFLSKQSGFWNGWLKLNIFCIITSQSNC